MNSHLQILLWAVLLPLSYALVCWVCKPRQPMNVQHVEVHHECV